ncbi:MAG: hypothetical protein Edafosvirus1_112 [Edafosvirus sp.]|uniref:Uncharacterized protein n=1 Tax=Edafosvirus sp. TaxID=2487765 RepID=A0A3G4ZUV7_9VIRU|nr:MAG: hypothetical protein Edafosvirus1_112 [Edafosvirus sp.]
MSIGQYNQSDKCPDYMFDNFKLALITMIIINFDIFFALFTCLFNNMILFQITGFGTLISIVLSWITIVQNTWHTVDNCTSDIGTEIYYKVNFVICYIIAIIIIVIPSCICLTGNCRC